MTFNLFLHPSEREGDFAVDLLAPSGPGAVEVPVQVHEVGGDLFITVFTHQEGPAWTYPLDDFRAALDRAAQALRDRG